MVETILSSPFVRELILPFLLIFALSYAILQKSQILGKDKKQTDAIVALVLGLLVVAIGNVTNIITSLVPVLAVGLVVLLAFFLLWGFASREGEFKVPVSIQWVIGGIAAVVVIAALLYYTNGLAYLQNLFSSGSANWLTNTLIVIVVVAAVWIIVGFTGKSETKKSE